jgi:hypothetical protein
MRCHHVAAMSERESMAGDHPPAASASDPAEPHAAPGAGLEPEVEVVDGFPVLAEVRAVERASPASLPAVQAAAAAGAGFVAGAATVALIKRRTARRVAARNARSRRPADLLPIAATRSFLVDVHVIAKPE